MTQRFVQATLVVPLGPNRGSMGVAQYDRNLAQLEIELIATFGGFTAVDGRGAMEDGSTVLREPVRVYTLALTLPPRVFHPWEIVNLRKRVKVLLDQRTVYLATYDLAEKPVQ